ncbi:MAG: SLBB domain-containing protein, partial [Candidatus Rokubacteria bacterium]|nr:SLBB domain-containing protein [Candidatus Rokubacteria bacterium]
IPPIGRIDVKGKTLIEAQRLVSERARALFRFADVSVSILTPRCVEMPIAGEIERPGSFQISAVRRIHEVLLIAGGVTPRGSVRQVQVTRDGQTTVLDLLRFELTGDLTQNPVVTEGMRIFVPPRGPYVTLEGGVRRPGDYEIGPTGSLRDLITLVGGFAQNAAPWDARLTRALPDGRRETVSVDLRSALVAPADVPLRAGDRLFVQTLSALQAVVEVRGAFNGSADSSRTVTGGKATIVQRFELAQGDRVKDILVRAGGPAAYADLRTGVVERYPAAGPRETIPIDLHRLLVEKDEAQNILLENGDVLMLPITEDKIFVLGEVRSPGVQDFRPELTAREYVALAGGPTVRGRFQKAMVTYRSGRTYPLAEAPPLEPGAMLTIPEVSVRWWQDYVAISSVLTGLISTYTGLFLLFGGGLPVRDTSSNQ